MEVETRLVTLLFARDQANTKENRTWFTRSNTFSIMRLQIQLKKAFIFHLLPFSSFNSFAGSGPISEEDVWVVITSYFESKGLVRQQLDSFNDFVKYSLPEIVSGTEDIILAPTHVGGQADQKVCA